MSYPKEAMVFAAGYGKRLEPLTLTTPKPLIKVGGKALIDYALDKLQQAGIEKIVVNTHHLADQIQRHLAGQDNIIISYEELLLETGGGVVKALPNFMGDAIYTINADIMWQDGKIPAFERLADFWDPNKMDMLLLLCPLDKAKGFHGKGDFDIISDGQLIKPDSGANFVYTGVQIVKKSLFEDLAEEPFSVNVFYKKALQDDGKLARVYGVIHDDFWYHIGTKQELEFVEGELR